MALRPKATESRIRCDCRMHHSRCTAYKNSRCVNLSMENCRAAMIQCNVPQHKFTSIIGRQ